MLFNDWQDEGYTSWLFNSKENEPSKWVPDIMCQFDGDIVASFQKGLETQLTEAECVKFCRDEDQKASDIKKGTGLCCEKSFLNECLLKKPNYPPRKMRLSTEYSAYYSLTF